MEKEKQEWIKKNADCFSNEEEAAADYDRRQAAKAAKESRVLRVFRNLNERNEFEEAGHKIGQCWDYDPEKEGKLGFPESDGYEEFVAICAYEYFD